MNSNLSKHGLWKACPFQQCCPVGQSSKCYKTAFKVYICCVLWIKQWQFPLALCSVVWCVCVYDTCSAVAQTDPVSTFTGAWLKLGCSSWNTFHPFPLSSSSQLPVSQHSLSLSKPFWWTVESTLPPPPPTHPVLCFFPPLPLTTCLFYGLSVCKSPSIHSLNLLLF